MAMALLLLPPLAAAYSGLPSTRSTAPLPAAPAIRMPAPPPHADALQLHRSLVRCARGESALGRAVAKALRVLEDAFRLYDPARVVASFNGGKDAVAILHLTRAVLAARGEAEGRAPRVSVIFFEVADEFSEVDAFLRRTVREYDLRLISCGDVGFAEGLSECIARHGTQAFVLGTREGDPNAAGQAAFTPSSDWMPPFMRVNPILDWTYAEVWAFLRGFSLPVCELYERGYTSLGKVAVTRQNPALRRPDGTYRPAWELVDGSLERAGRGAPVEAAGGAEADDDAPLSVSSAAMLVVGDELLKGKVLDTNTCFAARLLQEKGIDLKRVLVVTDTLEVIASELRQMHRDFDLVLTSGGLGPTHDDVTLRAVASALGVAFEPSDTMKRLIERRMSDAAVDPGTLHKMSMLPGGARLRPVPDGADDWPILQCGNIFALPGVPKIFEKKLSTICEHFVGTKPRAIVRQLAMTCGELDVVSALNSAVATHMDVEFGCYPVEQACLSPARHKRMREANAGSPPPQGEVKTVVTLEAPISALAQIESALADLVATLPEGCVVKVSEQFEEFDERLMKMATPRDV